MALKQLKTLNIFERAYMQKEKERQMSSLKKLNLLNSFPALTQTFEIDGKSHY